MSGFPFLHINIIFNYFLIFTFLYLAGNSYFKLISKFLNLQYIDNNNNLFKPIFGMFFIGNVLVIVNFFSKLKTYPVYILLIAIIIYGINLKNFKEFKNKISIINIFKYAVIPSVLLVSTYDINFHYDAGLYHLNTQNWLRESKIVFGLVNVSWPLAISSIYEYISSIFWINESMINLHYLQITFIHIFFNFLLENIVQKSNRTLSNSSMFIIIFLFLDNFGYGGGRNGSIYIQEVTMQDTPIAILTTIVCLFITKHLIENRIDKFELFSIVTFSLFLFQLKISTVVIGVLLFIYIFYLKLYKEKYFVQFLKINILFLIFWVLKNYILSGCLIFPVSLTCLNNFEWYVVGSTEVFEKYTSATSFGYESFIFGTTKSFLSWFNFFFFELGEFSLFYRNIYRNFFISIVLLLVIRKVFFLKNNSSLKVLNLIFLFLIFWLVFLILYGPIPRYTMMLMMLAAGLIGAFSGDIKYKINYKFLLIFFSISLVLLPRINSYKSMLTHREIIFNVEINQNFNGNFPISKFYTPIEDDRCWININCSSEDSQGILMKSKNFKYMFIYRK